MTNDNIATQSRRQVDLILKALLFEAGGKLHVSESSLRKVKDLGLRYTTEENSTITSVEVFDPTEKPE